MAEKQRWTMEEAQTLARRLDEAERPVDLDKRALVQGELHAVISRKLRQGWTHDAVCEELARLGVEVAPSTLRRYLRDAKAARRPRKRCAQAPGAQSRAPGAAEASSPSAPGKGEGAGPGGEAAVEPLAPKQASGAGLSNFRTA